MQKKLILTMLMALVAGSAAATPISIFNTGLDDFSLPLPGLAVDPHWTVDGGAAGVRDAGYPLPPDGPWIANTGTSQWISDNPIGGFGEDSAPSTTFIYETTFTLPAFASASLSGIFASDNRTLFIFLNGVAVAGTPNCVDSTSDESCFTTFDPFGPASGFIVGLNTLAFHVENGDGPSGLRVEVSGSYDESAPIPEPGTLLLLGSGLTALAARRRRRV